MSVAALVLAAGASRRMGRPKALLPWDGCTLLAWEFDELMRSAVDEIVIVVGAHAEAIRRSLDGGARHCVYNPRWAQGRAGSLAIGAQALCAAGRPQPEAIVVQNVDQPTRHQIVDRLLEELRSVEADAVQPSYQGKAGHPVVLSGSLLGQLSAVREETLGLRGVLNQHQPALLAMDDDPVVRLDLDTPDTLEQARRLLGVSA